MAVHHSCLLMAVILALGTPQEDPESLFQQLGSESIEERENATQKLKELGEGARAALEKAVDDNDPEVASRARYLTAILDARRILPTRVLQAMPGIENQLAMNPHAWTIAFLEAADSKKRPDLENTDLSSLVARALQGAQSAREKDAILGVISSRRLRAVPELIRLLEDDDATVRLHTATVLAELEGKAAVPGITRLLNDEDPDLQLVAVGILERFESKEQAPAIMALLGSGKTAHKALDVLNKWAIPVPDEMVRKMLVSSDETVRFIAVGLACQRTPRLFRTALIEALRQAGSHEIRTVEDAVARSGPSWNDLKPLVDDENDLARLSVLCLARRLRWPEVLETAVRLLDDPYEDTRVQAVQTVVAWGAPETVRRIGKGKGPGTLIALAQLGAPSARERALSALESSDAVMRRAGLTALRKLDVHEESDRIKALLGDPAPDVRVEAARILPHLAGDASGPEISARLEQEEDPKVQEQLLLTVAETGYAPAAPHALRFLNSKDSRVVGAAAQVAGALRLEEAVPTLVRLRSYEPLLQIRPPNLVDLLRMELKECPTRGVEDADLWSFGSRFPEEEYNDRVLYLLYASPPGAREFLVRCIERGIVPDYPVEKIRFFRAVELFPWLIGEMDTPSRTRVDGAGRLLAAWGRRDLADKAVGWLSSPRERTRMEGEVFLVTLDLKEKVPAIAALLESPEEQTCSSAWRTLLGIGGPEVVEIFRKRLRKGTPMSRADAALALACQKDVQSISEIEPLLGDGDPDVREMAARALAKLGSTGSFDRVVRAFKREPQKYLRNWHYHLVGIGGVRGRAIVREDLDHADQDVRKNAVRAMGFGGGYVKDEIDLVESYLSDPDVGDEALEALAKMDPERFLLLPGRNVSARFLEDTIGLPMAIPALIRLLKTGDEGRRGYAAKVLGCWNVQEAVEPLAQVLHSDNASDRQHAAVALARLGDARGLDEIMKLPRRLPTVRMEEALLALNGIRHPEAFHKVVSAKWALKSGWYCTLEEAMTDATHHVGMKCTFSKEIGDLDRRTPSEWAQRNWDMDEVASMWNHCAAFVIDPAEIRVMTPEEALRFWQTWARAPTALPHEE